MVSSMMHHRDSCFI